MREDAAGDDGRFAFEARADEDGCQAIAGDQRFECQRYTSDGR